MGTRPANWRRRPVPAPTPKYAWDRQPRESTRAYEYFVVYRDLPSSRRAVRVVAEQMGVCHGTASNFASQFNWTKRVAAYIEYLSAEATAARLRAIEEATRDEINIGRKLMTQADESLDTYADVDEFALKPPDVVNFAKAGSDLRRRGLGLPRDAEPATTVNTQVNVQVNATIAGIVKKLDDVKVDDVLEV